ncbi:MAG: hypothetical protein ACM336_10165 [Acidobacteriota bacterium]
MIRLNAMLFCARVDPQRAIGRSPDHLSLDELAALEGKFVALEIYTPKSVPLRTIEAVGDTAEDCIRQLAARGRDPRHFEFTMLKARR